MAHNDHQLGLVLVLVLVLLFLLLLLERDMMGWCM